MRITRRRFSATAVAFFLPNGSGQIWGNRHLDLVGGTADHGDAIELPDIDFPDPSRLLDIERQPPVPLSVQILQLMALKVQSTGLQKQIERECDALKKRIVTELGDLKAGYLLKLNLYGDEHGQAVVPGGQIVLPVGVGTEPLDALAELLRLPGLDAPPPPSSLTNFSSYVWLFRKDGKLIGRTITKELRVPFEKRAREEAVARARLSTWMRIVPDSVWDRVQRADYWQKIYADQEQRLNEAARRQRIKALTGRMSQLQDRVNSSSDKFRDILRNMAEQSMALQAMSTALQLVAAINAAASSGQLDDESSRPVRTDSEPDMPTDKMVTIRTNAYESYRTGVRALEIEVQGPVNEMKKINDQLLQEWGGGNVVIHPPEPLGDQLIPWR